MMVRQNGVGNEEHKNTDTLSQCLPSYLYNHFYPSSLPPPTAPVNNNHPSIASQGSWPADPSEFRVKVIFHEDTWFFTKRLLSSLSIIQLLQQAWSYVRWFKSTHKAVYLQNKVNFVFFLNYNSHFKTMVRSVTDLSYLKMYRYGIQWACQMSPSFL